MKLHSAYLVVYNTVQLCLWAQVLFRSFFTIIIAGRDPTTLPVQLYDASILYAEVGQTLAWMEVVHAAVGLVGGGVATAFVQCLGRYVVLIYVAMPIRFTHSMWHVVVMLMAWALADVVRYAFYIQTLVGRPSRGLLWMRYSMFLVLYPVGVAAEWMLYYLTLEYVDHMEIYKVTMPNSWNFAFDFGVWNRVVLVLYFYFGPFMFMHMLRQRSKKLKSNGAVHAS